MLSEDMQALVRSILATRASMGDTDPEVPILTATLEEPILVTESDLTQKEEV